MKKLVQLKNKENENLYPINLNYEKRISKLEDNAYSTEEQVVGTWVDGKPIYKKMIEFHFEPESEGTNSYSLDVSHLNIDSFVDLETIVKKGSNMNFSNNFYMADTNFTFIFYRDNSLQFRIGVDAFKETSSGYVILEYTKTTD